MIAIIDYGMGNVKSVYNAFRYLNQETIVTSDEYLIRKATHIVLPGVGAFGDAITNIRNCGLEEILYQNVVVEKKPFLGICLGMQVLAKTSEEYGFHKGLGFIDATVKKMNTEETGFPLPHVGWNDIHIRYDHFLFHNLKKNPTYYFVHSYHMVCNDDSLVIATCNYGIDFTASIMYDNIFATQFHPEKSHSAGIQLLNNFSNWRP